MTIIIADHRERSSGVIKQLAKDFKIEEKQLIVGDYIVQTQDKEDKVFSVGIERKTKNDFLNSIIDKRILSQCLSLKEAFDRQLLIIEGVENIYSLRKFHPNAIRGMLTAIAIDFQIPIIYSRNYKDTAKIISSIANRLNKPRKELSLMTKRKPAKLKEQQEFLIEALPGIGNTLSKSLLKKFGSVKKIFNAKEEKLQKVEKIGKKKAEEIRKVIDSEYKD